MDDITIKVRNLGKKYLLYDSPEQRVKEILHPFRKKYHHEFWALKDLSFEVKKGEVVSIIGQNGSGKSTLLQIISGVLQPTEGQVEVKGRVAALLELGAGFNPEFTGRENVYMNGAILGFSKEEMDKKINAIEEFADIGEFIDQPVKTYSSGMYARLAFSVSIHVDPAVLIIDEILSVGDIRFGIKCMDRLRQIKEKGTSIIYVTHSNNGFGDWGILLEKGQEIKRGTLFDVWEFYTKRMLEGSKVLIPQTSEKNNTISDERNTLEDKALGSSAFDTGANVEFHVANRPPVGDSRAREYADGTLLYKESQEFLERTASLRFGTGEVRVVNAELLNMACNPVTIVRFGQKLRYRVHLRVDANVPFLGVGFNVRNRQGMSIIGGVSWTDKVPLVDLHKDDKVVFEFLFEAKFFHGEYIITTGCAYRTTLMPGEPSMFDNISITNTFEVAPFEIEYHAIYYAPVEMTARIDRDSGRKSKVSDYEAFVISYANSLRAFE